MVTLVLAAAWFFSSPVLAAEHMFTPRVSLGTVYDDNIFFDEKSDAEFTLSPAFSYRYALEDLEAEVSAEVDVIRYPDHDEYDRENQLYSLATRYGLSDLASLSFQGSLRLDNTFDERLEETGEVTDKQERTQVTLNPGVEFILTERDRLNIEVSLTDTDYERSEDTDRRDYTAYTLGLTLIHAWTPRTSLLLAGSASQVDVEDEKRSVSGVTIGQFDQTQQSFQATVGVEHAWSDNVTFSASAGGSYSRSEYELRGLDPRFLPVFAVPVEDDVDEDSFGGVFDVGLTWEQELFTLTAGASRSLTQDADGENITRDRLDSSLNVRLSENLRWTLGGAYVTSETAEDSGDGGDTLDTTRIAARTALTYILSRRADLSLRYRYTDIDDRSDNDDDSRNRVGLWFTYRYPIQL